jgi:hypothetical protein
MYENQLAVCTDSKSFECHVLLWLDVSRISVVRRTSESTGDMEGARLSRLYSFVANVSFVDLGNMLQALLEIGGASNV